VVQHLRHAMRRCTVVIPNVNGEEFLPRCLNALSSQSIQDFDVIIVDDGSTDGSVGLVHESFPAVRVIELGANHGFARAMNVGIEAATGQYVVLLNNDTEAAPDWLAELVACMERHPGAAGAASKTVLMGDRRLIDGAGDMMDWSFRPLPRGHTEPDSERYGAEIQVFSASGAASIWRKDALCDIGLFDEDFFMYYEDVDLGFRARLLGYECWYAPRSVALHTRGASTAGRSEFTFFHPVKNRWFMIIKNTPAFLLARHALRILYGEAYWWREAVRHGKVRVLLRAYAAVGRSLPRLLAQRRELQRRRRVSLRQLDRALRKQPA
jgi:GT2 family glycosyltransferase